MTYLMAIVSNLALAAVMVALSMFWYGQDYLRKKKQFGPFVERLVPSLNEWRTYYWARVRRYIATYAVVLALIVLVPVFMNKATNLGLELLRLLYILPGLIGYFVLAGLFPARYTFYREGFLIFALIPFLPGLRDRQSPVRTQFRIGFRRWREFSDVFHRQGVIVAKAEPLGSEILIPKGRRDHLLQLGKEGLKHLKEKTKKK